MHDEAAKAEHLERLKSMNAEEMREKVEKAKAEAAEKERLEAEKHAARERDIAEHTALGKTAFAAGDYAEAERQFDLVMLNHPPKPAEIVCNRAACALKLKRYADAVSDAAEATYLDPTYVKAHYRLALAQQAMGRLDRAQKACRAALALEPTSQQLIKLEAELQAAMAEQEAASREQTP